MLKTFAITVCILSIFVSPSSGQTEFQESNIRNLVETYVARDGFSGTVLVARRGDILIEASFGQANIEWAVPNVPAAHYRIGSLTKPFTATLTMILVEEGIISLEGTLGEYLPDLYGGTPIAAVTVEQLLGHTSGIVDLAGNYNDPWYQTAGRLSYEHDDFAREWIKPVLKEKPGEKWRYNNAGYILLGGVIEHVTGQSFSDNLEKRIFLPSGMGSSGLFADRSVIKNMAFGYARTAEGEMVQPPHIDSSIFYSAAGIYSTAGDILRFDRALYTEKLLKAETRELMLTRKTDFPYGFGWGLDTWPLMDGGMLTVVSHTGSVPGYQSYYLRSEENEDFVIVMSNFNQGALVVALGRDLMRALNEDILKRNLGELLVPVALKEGTSAMLEVYQNLGDKLAEYDHGVPALNKLGYEFLGLDKMDAAIEVFEWNVAFHPQSANPRDSLGEAYRAAGRIAEAIKSYEAALALNPESQSAATALKEMRSGQ